MEVLKQLTRFSSRRAVDAGGLTLRCAKCTPTILFSGNTLFFPLQ